MVSSNIPTMRIILSILFLSLCFFLNLILAAIFSVYKAGFTGVAQLNGSDETYALGRILASTDFSWISYVVAIVGLLLIWKKYIFKNKTNN